MSASDLGPLDWKISIVSPGGKPTPEFQRRWDLQRQNNHLIGVTLGTGAPTAVPTGDGQEYADTSTTPYTLYVSKGATWHLANVNKFTQLSDVPNSYTSANSKLVRVNSGATGLEFDSLSATLDGLGSTQGDILYRDTAGWQALAPGTAGNVLTTGGAGANPSWAAGGGGGGSAFHPGYTVGRYYLSVGAKPAGPGTIGFNTLVAVPFYVATNTTFAAIAANVTLGASANVRLGVYSNNNGQPKTLLYDSGSLSTVSTGIVSNGTVTLSAGWCWLAYLGSSNIQLTNVTYDSEVWSWLVGLNPASDTMDVFANSVTFGALPATYPVAYSNNGSPFTLPAIFLKA